MNTTDTVSPDQTATERVAAAIAARRATREEEAAAADEEVARQFEAQQAKIDLDLMILGDAGGSFRGVFRAPDANTYKQWRAEMRSDQQRAIANQNLAVKCMLWPTHEVLAGHAAKRPALYDALGIALQTAAGAGEEAIVRK